MFTDIKGFTERTSRSTREDLVYLLRTHEAVVLPIVRERDGTLIKGIGDAYLFTFESPTDAVLAGIEVQAAVRKHNEEAEEHRCLELRIAISAGEVTLLDGDVFGNAVNIAARIEGIAETDQVYLSEAVLLTMNKQELANALEQHGLRVDDVGRRRLKGLDEEVSIHRIVGRATPPPASDFDPELPTGIDLTRGAQPALPAQPLLEGPTLGRRTTDRFGNLVLRPPPTPLGLSETLTRKDFALRVAFLLAAFSLSALGGMLFAAGLLLHAWLPAVVSVLWLVVTQPLHLGLAHRKTLIVRSVAVVLALVLSVSLADRALREVQSRADGLASQLVGSEIDSFSLADTTAAYLFGWIAIAGLSLSGQRDLAEQELTLFVGGGKKRRWRSDFPMAFASVATPLKSLSKRLHQATDPTESDLTLEQTAVALEDGRSDTGVAYPIGSLVISAKAAQTDNGWKIHAQCSAEIAHRRKGKLRIAFVRGRALTIDQGLLWMLQRRAWISRYQAHWHWTLPAHAATGSAAMN